MIDFFFAIMAASMGGAGAAPPPAAAQVQVQPQDQGSSVVVGEGVVIGQGTAIEGVAVAKPEVPSVPASPALPAAAPLAPALIQPQEGMNMAVVPAGLVPEPQVPTGTFTTATEVRPILQATKGNWVAVREFNGQDLLYVTHLWAWRCGLAALAISVNDEPMQNWPLPPCHADSATPNAILDSDGLPYLTLRLGSVEKIEVQIVYDDLTMERASWARAEVKMP
jgi:hypothetical protein